MASKVHAAKVNAHKWGLGQALCGCTISRYTPVSKDPPEVTCPRCKVALLSAYSEPGRLVDLPGSERKAVAGTAQVRAGERKPVCNLWVVSAVTDRMLREDLDSSGDVFLAQAVADTINGR